MGVKSQTLYFIFIDLALMWQHSRLLNKYLMTTFRLEEHLWLFSQLLSTSLFIFNPYTTWAAQLGLLHYLVFFHFCRLPLRVTECFALHCVRLHGCIGWTWQCQLQTWAQGRGSQGPFILNEVCCHLPLDPHDDGLSEDAVLVNCFFKVRVSSKE